VYVALKIGYIEKSIFVTVFGSVISVQTVTMYVILHVNFYSLNTP